MENRFYTIDQVAEILELHHKTVRKFIKEGELNANKVGKQWRISQSDLKNFMNDRNTDTEDICINDDEIEFSKDKDNTESIPIKVSSVVDINKLGKEEYSKISNMLLAIMNCKDSKSSGATINMKYNEEENRLRIMLWAGLDLTKEILDVISMLTKKEEEILENKGGKRNES